MSNMDQFKTQARTALLPIPSLALAAGIFTLDTFTVSEVAASVLYVALVLLSYGRHRYQDQILKPRFRL